MGQAPRTAQWLRGRLLRAIPRSLAATLAVLASVEVHARPLAWLVDAVAVVLVLSLTSRRWWRYVLDDNARRAPSPPVEFSEPGNCNVALEDVGRRRIEVVRALREIGDLDLVSAKSLTDRTPSSVVERLSHRSAERVLQRLKAAGADGRIREPE